MTAQCVVLGRPTRFELKHSQTQIPYKGLQHISYVFAGRDVSQYAHTRWKIRDSFTKGGLSRVKNGHAEQ